MPVSHGFGGAGERDDRGRGGWGRLEKGPFLCLFDRGTHYFQHCQEKSSHSQAHAPLTASQAGSELPPHRQLLLFACLKEGCGGAGGSWETWRCQALSPAHTAPTSARPQSGQEGPLSPPPSPKKAASVFADALAGGTEALDDPFDFDELTAELEALPGGEPARPAGSGAPPPATKLREREEARAESSSTAGPACLPCFFLYGEEERAGTGRSGAVTANSGEGPSAGGAESEEEGGGLTWAGEAWEEDKVLRPGGPDAPFLKFAKTLARCPDQCLRLGYVVCVGGGCSVWV